MERKVNLQVLISVSRDDPGQRHVGFMFGTPVGGVELIHLGWHKMLLKWSEDYYKQKIGDFLPLDCAYFSEEEAEDIAAFVNHLWTRYKGTMPYSIITDGLGGFFNLSGDISIEKAGIGLTCSTFLMSVFSVQGYTLVNESDWQRRSEDRTWHMKVINQLRASNAEVEHVKAQEKYIGYAFRYRPEEVVGCANSYEGAPFAFCAAVAAGEGVLASMRKSGLMPA